MKAAHTTRTPTESGIDRWLDMVVAMSSFPDAEHLYDVGTDAGRYRLHNLRAYLSVMARVQPDTLLVGEAPGYRGTAQTGIPFVSPSMLRGAVSGVPEFFSDQTVTVPVVVPTPAEVTSAVVWRTLLELPTMPLLWAAYPHHPYLTGDPLTNRTPTAQEVSVGRDLIVALIELYDVKRVVALGNVASGVLSRLGIDAQKVRHPARGGASIFRRQVTELLSTSLPGHLQHRDHQQDGEQDGHADDQHHHGQGRVGGR